VARAKPVITATQMLESMIEHARPTRAEASDVANAIYDGTSAVMLSGETAAGAYPVEVVRTMDRIVRRTESDLLAKIHAGELASFPPAIGAAELGSRVPSIAEATVRAAARAACDAQARAVVVLTDHGSTAHLVARERLPMAVVALTPTRGTWRRLALEWGVVPGRVAYATGAKRMIAHALRAVVALGRAAAGDRVVLVAGRLRESGATNTVGIREIPRTPRRSISS
jgi:pyruvate kinase